MFIASRFLSVRFPGILVSKHRFLLGAHASRVEKDAGAHRASVRGRELISRDSGSHRADCSAALDPAGGDRVRAPDTGPLRKTEDTTGTTGVNRVPVAAAKAVGFGGDAVCGGHAVHRGPDVLAIGRARKAWPLPLLHVVNGHDDESEGESLV